MWECFVDISSGTGFYNSAFGLVVVSCSNLCCRYKSPSDGLGLNITVGIRTNVYRLLLGSLFYFSKVVSVVSPPISIHDFTSSDSYREGYPMYSLTKSQKTKNKNNICFSYQLLPISPGDSMFYSEIIAQHVR